MSISDLAQELARVAQGRVETNWVLKGLTTYRLGGPAALYFEPLSEADLEVLAAALGAMGSDAPPVLCLGRGSNLVVSDEGWPGIVLHLGPAFSWIEALEDAGPGLRAGAATPMPLLANWSARRGLSGLEFAIAIPGSVGGAIRMNAGAHGRDTSGALHSTRIFDLDELRSEERKASELDYSYRRSNLTDREVVLEARWALEEAPAADVRATMEGFRRHRAETQPGAVQNAGSVFKNPEGDHAGRLVEAAGLKGFRVGGASVSELHANFFIAEKGASAQDVYDLVRRVRSRVMTAFGIDLVPEIRFVGHFNQPEEEQ